MPTTRPAPTSAKKTAAKKAAPAPASDTTPVELIDAKIASLADWRGPMLAWLRSVILAVDPDVTEEVKWGGTPTWSHDGILCTGETYKAVVKATFARGASLPDPHKLFNASLDGNTRRAIDFREGDLVDEAALKALIRAAVAFNQSKGQGKKKA